MPSIDHRGICSAVGRIKERSDAGCVGHDFEIEGESPLWDLSEVTMSEKQLHEPDRRLSWPCCDGFAVRSCEMEARSESLRRTKVNLQAGCLIRVSEPGRAKPDIRSGSSSSEGGSSETFLNLTPRDLDRSSVSPRPKARGTACEGNDNGPKSIEKSDHLIVATKPSNAGGAKGMTN